MAVDQREKASKPSKTVFPWLRPFRGRCQSTIVVISTIAVIAIILLLVASAELIHFFTTEDKALGIPADLLLQGAGLVAAGLILTPLIQRINKFRNQRMDFMLRIREAHVQIANAQRFIYADRSCTTYSEQMRMLMRVTPKLEDIERDIAATIGLFKPADKVAIQEGIKEIVAYLDKGYDQYAEWCHGGDYETLRQRKSGWLGELVKCRRSMPEEYGRALDKSKGTIRCYVYGGGTDRAMQDKTLVRRLVDDLLNAKNLDASKLALAGELLVDDFALHLGRLAIKGREDFKINLQRWRTDFPDGRISIERLAAEDDRVVSCWTCEATHSALLMGIAATRKKISWTANVILRIENRRIAEINAAGDMLGLMRQLEAPPEPTSGEYFRCQRQMPKPRWFLRLRRQHRSMEEVSSFCCLHRKVLLLATLIQASPGFYLL